MTITEILELADELVYANKGKHLDELQETIIKGVWENQTYQEIADQCNRSESRVRNVASQLWKLLSEKLGENIDKDNFRYTFNRLNISPSPNICNVGNSGNNNCNFGSQILYNSNPDNQDNNINNQSKTFYHDLNFAPKILTFYDRPELKTLNNYIFNQNIKLISVLGLSGIGKTYLVKRFVDLNLDQFEVIIWKNLKLTNDLSQIMTDILSKNLNDQDSQIYISNQIDQFLNLLKTKRCLIIFDHVQELFIKEKLAGQFQEKFKNYQDLFNLIKEIDHQSHFILISDEKSKSMISLHQEVSNVKSLELEGLNNSEILNNFNLQDEESWLTLIQLYQGNFYYLKDIVSLINDVFGGKVKDFLALNQLILTEDMKSHLSQILTRLSPIEREIILKLSQHNQPISTEELTENLTLELIDLINGLQSLQQRYLVTQIKEEQIIFKISPVFKEYIINYTKD
jgi:hypothetical protein